VKQYNKKYYQENKEAILQRNKRWGENHKGEKKELDKKYPGTFNIRVKSSKGNVTQVAKTIPMSIEKKK